MNRLILYDDVVRDVKHLFDPGMHKCLSAVQRAADECRFAPRGLLCVDYPDLVLRIRRPQFERERNALVWCRTFAPLANTHSHGNCLARVVVRKGGVVDGVGITVTMNESGEPRGAPAAAFAGLGFLWWLELNGQHAVQR